MTILMGHQDAICCHPFMCCTSVFFLCHLFNGRIFRTFRHIYYPHMYYPRIAADSVRIMQSDVPDPFDFHLSDPIHIHLFVHRMCLVRRSPYRLYMLSSFCCPERKSPCSATRPRSRKPPPVFGVGSAGHAVCAARLLSLPGEARTKSPVNLGGGPLSVSWASLFAFGVQDQPFFASLCTSRYQKPKRILHRYRQLRGK